MLGTRSRIKILQILYKNKKVFNLKENIIYRVFFSSTMTGPFVLLYFVVLDRIVIFSKESICVIYRSDVCIRAARSHVTVLPGGNVTFNIILVQISKDHMVFINIFQSIVASK